MLLALLAFGQTAWPQYSGGTGTEANPYLISSKADWNTLSTQVKNGNLYTGKFFKMTADIGTVTTPIGYTSDGSFYNDDVRGNFFEGTFDGNGHTLTVKFGYTFEGNTTDYASRFRLVFVANDADLGSENNDDFAFISNGNIIINGTGTIQVIDLLGRQLFSREVNSSLLTPHSPPVSMCYD